MTQMNISMTKKQRFPGGPVVKNSPANAGDTGSIPGLGRCHGATEPMSCNYWEPPHLGPMLCNKKLSPQ